MYLFLIIFVPSAKFASLFSTGEPNAGQITPGEALPLVRRGRRRNPSSYLLSVLSQTNPGYLWPPFLQEHIVTQFFCPGGTLSPSWQSCFPANYPLGYTGASGYSLSNAGFRIALWIAWDFSNLQRSLWIVVKPSFALPSFFTFRLAGSVLSLTVQ